ncbi:acetyl/propionyl-CoA carboxylase alpha subunit [Bradyrhizobium sp. USDA 4509]
MSSSLKKLLIANRGEIAVHIARSAADLGIATVAIHPEYDAKSLHVEMIDEAVVLQDTGATSRLDVSAVVEAAREAKCDVIHAGYGFLSENEDFDEDDVLLFHDSATWRDVTCVHPRRDGR